MVANAAARAATAAHRFGLGEPDLAPIGADPVAWLRAQIGPADAQRGERLVSAATGLRHYALFVQRQRLARAASAAESMAGDMRSGEQQFGEHFRELVQADVRARLTTAAGTTRPFAERLALFWANHFTVSMAKASARGLVGAFEREAIRPHIAGRFETMLVAAVKHPGMLRYLDNDQSAGPNSRLAQRVARRVRADDERQRIAGLNENLAREVLELHTLGAAGGGQAYGGWGGYTQTDVTELARVLTGWRVALRDFSGDAPKTDAEPSRFEETWHEPGSKTLLGQRYAEGPQALDQVLRDLARHRSTARFLSLKLARHFVADQPPAALVERLERRYLVSDGDLGAVYAELLAAPEAWDSAPAKLKSPEEFVLGSVRLLGLGDAAFARQPDAGLAQLGQRVQAAPSPAGWPDQAEEWLGPDAMWKRIEWATRLADRLGRQHDARALASASLGPRLAAATRQQIERAADGPQALALLLLAPEFQRR